jgi:myo-inositol 2-dehydrogenase/D-chiro-inositol 1-dehydrogenase
MSVNVAFYGAGARAQPYLQALARRPDVSLTAVCDLDRRSAEQTAAGWGADVYLSYEAMLQEAQPDVLWVCVEPYLQGDVLLKAAEQGIPFFAEPPGAVDYDRARAYGRRIAEANLVTAVGFTGRYADVVHEAREYLGANPVPLALGWWLRRPDAEGTCTAESLLWTDAARFVDALRLFCGEVDRVRSLRAGPGATEGGLVIQLEFAGGTVGVLTCATFARAEPRLELEFMGEGWSLAFGADLATLRLAERDKTTILRCLNVPVDDHVQAFLAAVAAQAPAAVAPGYADALHTLAVCQAATLSAREGRPVTLAEVEGSADSGASPGNPK